MKVLYVLSYISRNGGVQSVVNNYLNNLDTNKINVEFLTLLPGDEEMEEEWRKKGCKIYQIRGSKEKNLFLFLKEIKKFFKEHHDYDIIHSHQTNLDFFYLREAKKWKIPVRIMHAHSTSCDINWARMAILRLMSKKYANYYFACSKEAGRWMFGKNIERNKNFHVLNNAIDVQRFTYNEIIREKLRKENNLENCFVLGNVARMSKSKNHKFLLNIFKEILKIEKKSKLLLIGDGPLKDELIKEAKELKIYDNVIFYGVSDKINELLQAMDVFVLPSLFEGVPLSVIEAAGSGIKYVISDNIDSHLKTNENELKVSLRESAADWAEKIIKFSKKYNRTNQTELLRSSGFDIVEESEKLKKIYIDIAKEEK